MAIVLASKSFGRIVVITIVSPAVLFCCVNYLQLKAEVTTKMKSVATLESELSQLKEENNAYESQVLAQAAGEKNLYRAIGKQEDLTDYIVHTPYENLDRNCRWS